MYSFDVGIEKILYQWIYTVKCHSSQSQGTKDIHLTRDNKMTVSVDQKDSSSVITG